jgi:hypothetical protein
LLEVEWGFCVPTHSTKSVEWVGHPTVVLSQV